MSTEKLRTVLNLMNKTLNIPTGCNTSASYMKDRTGKNKDYIQFTFNIPLDDVIPLIQKWNGWKNAYKYRKR